VHIGILTEYITAGPCDVLSVFILALSIIRHCVGWMS
jgi:hypothetical protein